MNFPFKRIFAEKRRSVILVLGALAVNIALYALVVYPLTVRVRGAEQRLRDAEQELLVAQREDSAARAIVQGRDRADAALQAFYKGVLPPGMASARDLTYLRLAQIAQRHNIRIIRRSADNEPVKQNAGEQTSMARVRLVMTLDGGYEDVRRFIYQLESGDDFLVIDSVVLAQDAQPGGSLALTLGISTYYRSEPHGA